jgi:hypothetical protein
VVPIYIDNNGIEYIGKTSEGVRNFRVSLNATNQPPFTALISPSNGVGITNQTVNLTWLGYDPDNDELISYELYFGADYQAVFQRHETVKRILPDPTVNYFQIGNLKEDEIYYWTVIPTAKGDQGSCLSGVSSFGVDLTNNEPCTFLVLPSNDTVVPKPPILYWEFIDQDPFEELTFEIYLSSSKSEVESLSQATKIATVRKGTNYYLHSLYKTYIFDNVEYYWTVIGYDKGGIGICESGVWSFMIDENITNHPPVTKLIKPISQTNVFKDTVWLYWNGSDIDNDKITYTLYFSDDYGSVSTMQNNVKIGKIKGSTFKIVDLTHGKRYYWTVIPDDGSVPGLCLDRVWSFKVDLENNPDTIDDERSSRTMMSLILIALIIFILVIISIIWLIRKRKYKRYFRRYLQADSDSELPSDIKASLLSTKTLRALQQDLDEQLSTSEPEEEIELQSQPYRDGEYEPEVPPKSRYRPKTKYAAHVKRAIPYARGSKDETKITSETDMELAKPLEKKISTDEPFKASSLPITKECPGCGSFKVKTFEDGTSKCLVCKLVFSE